MAAGGRKTAGQRFAAADERLTKWLADARLVVMLALGSAWTERWLEAGFTHRATSVPKRLAGRIALAGGLVAFFTDHPEFAVPFADVTTEVAAAVYEEVTAADGEVRVAKTAAASRKRLRDSAEAHLRKRMHHLADMLRCLFPKDDARWLDFGLNQPSRGCIPRPSASFSGGSGDYRAGCNGPRTGGSRVGLAVCFRSKARALGLVPVSCTPQGGRRGEIALSLPPRLLLASRATP